MTLEIVLLPAAAADLAEARGWYEAQQEGLGARFLDAVDKTLKLIASRPKGFPVILSDARKALVPKFPYTIYYRARPQHVRVLGVVHQHRHPRTCSGA